MRIVQSGGRSDAKNVHVHERKGFSDIVDTYCVLVLELIQQNRHKHPGAGGVLLAQALCKHASASDCF